ncbi:MAG: hypothetical protein POELPBGB_03584 [Bacteroidia bacterium]|nr:hypothetical protein [Bacteroidia bacterium]
MTRIEKAIEKLKHLPKKDQNRFAEMVLDEVIWQETFRKTANKLDELGKSILEEIQKGKFKRMPH